MMKTEIEQIGWNVAAGVGGGAIRHIKTFISNPKNKFPTLLTGSIVGCLCAVFITPLVAKQFGFHEDPEKTTGFAFLLGVLGLEGVELCINKLRKMIGVEDKR